MPIPLEFTDKSMLVIGHERGIGFAISKDLAEAGADVVISYTSKDATTSNQSLLSTPVAHMVSPEPSFDPSSVSPVPVNLDSDPIGVSNMKNVGLRKQIYLVSSFFKGVAMGYFSTGIIANPPVATASTWVKEWEKRSPVSQSVVNRRPSFPYFLQGEG
ncbi:cytoplasmic protein [Cryptococcus neoformans]|nr:cytoplasmic protein [Cryptococcus neoformans var. grubii AD1-7a]OXH28505.1 cytoplasmic protein [Cryptococcus neoformans var. grubii]